MLRSKLHIALQYAKLGWLVLPVHHPVKPGVCSCRKGPKCKSAGKHPRINKWQNQATTDEEQIRIWWTKWPNANIGVLLGQRSGIIDIECDSPEAEKAWRLLFCEQFGGDIPTIPCFRSHRGMHRILKWSEGFPPTPVCHSFGIEIRTGNVAGAMSVFPGSVHGTSGKLIEWEVRPDGV